MAMLKRVGIEEGKPLDSTPRQEKLLEEAAFVGEAMAKADDLASCMYQPIRLRSSSGRSPSIAGTLAR